MAVDMNDMTVFAAVVEHSGFSAAGRALGLPKSNVSRRVARLEDALGARLLERSTRRLRLTEVGTIYHRHCRRIVEEAEHAERSVDELLEVPRGLLRVAATITAGQQLLGPLVAEFLTGHPEIDLDLTLTNRPVDAIEEGFDVVVRVGALADSGLIAKALGASRFHLYAGTAYMGARDAPDDPAMLAGHDCLVMGEDPSPTTWRLSSRGGERTIRVRPRVTVNDYTTLRRVAVDGGGIAPLPSYMCDELEQSGELIRVLPGWSLPPVPFHAVFPSHRGATPKVRAFLDFLAERIARSLAAGD